MHVEELLDRLNALGFGVASDAPAAFNEAARSLVEAFQRSRGLAVTGEVDEATWQRLDEAGWTLGDRLLYLTKPYLRGDDVADVQVRLSQLGFNPGRIDGVFGPLLHNALSDFQRNCGLTIDGTLTRRTLHELRRVSTGGADRTLVSEVHDITDGPRSTGPLLVWGTSQLCRDLAPRMPDSDRPVGLYNETSLADYANQSKARGVIAISNRDDFDGIHLHYWSSYRSYSRYGERLATSVAAAIANTPADIRLTVSGMALPILRETQMTTLLVEHGPLKESDSVLVVDAIAGAVIEFFHN